MKKTLKALALALMMLSSFIFTTPNAASYYDSSEFIKCSFCNGTGVCHKCSGTGDMSAMGYPQLTCTYCKGSGICEFCEGECGDYTSVSITDVGTNTDGNVLIYYKISGSVSTITLQRSCKTEDYFDVGSAYKGAMIKDNYDVVPGTIYNYRLVSKTGSGNYICSDSYTVKVALAKPVFYTDYCTTYYKTNKLYWSEVAGAVQYKLYRSTSQNGSYKLYKTLTNNYLYFKASTVNTYYYKVKAIGTDGITSESGTIKFSPAVLSSTSKKSVNLPSAAQFLPTATEVSLKSSNPSITMVGYSDINIGMVSAYLEQLKSSRYQLKLVKEYYNYPYVGFFFDYTGKTTISRGEAYGKPSDKTVPCDVFLYVNFVAGEMIVNYPTQMKYVKPTSVYNGYTTSDNMKMPNVNLSCTACSAYPGICPVCLGGTLHKLSDCACCYGTGICPYCKGTGSGGTLRQN